MCMYIYIYVYIYIYLQPVCIYISNQYENQCSNPHYENFSLIEKNKQVFNFNKTMLSRFSHVQCLQPGL